MGGGGTDGDGARRFFRSLDVERSKIVSLSARRVPLSEETLYHTLVKAHRGEKVEGENVDVLNAVVRFDPFTNAWEEVRLPPCRGSPFHTCPA